MSSPSKYITMRSVNSFGNHENDMVFEGMTETDELYSISIPANEITDSLDYIIERRIEYITLEKRRLNNEQRKLKDKLKLWKSMSL